jgi:hypothetical protein
MGLRGSFGLFASPQWWESINLGRMPLRRATGVIVRLYESGQDHTGVHNAFELQLSDGSTEEESIYVNERSEAKLFEVGSVVQVLYALEELKSRDENGLPEISDIVLEMAVSLQPNLVRALCCLTGQSTRRFYRRASPAYGPPVISNVRPQMIRPLQIPSELENLLEALHQPFTPEDVRGGWTEEARRRALRVAEAAVADLNAGSVPEAARHFLRWLDHDGVTEGP